MKIGIVCYLTEKLGPKSQGYYYRLYHLGEELIKRGHQITFFAAYGSKTSGKLISPSISVGRGKIEITNIKNAAKASKNFDLINIQMDHRGVKFEKLFKCPVLHTIIYGNFWPEIIELLEKYKRLNYSAISKSLTNKYPHLNWRGIAHNGLDLNDFQFQAKPKNYFLFIGRLHPEKGAHVAAKIAKKTKQKLIIAGPIQNKIYFNEKIKPYLSKNIAYFGKASFKEKIKLYQNARLLVFPLCHDEGFGNTIIESLACGTPVAAYGRGAVLEIVKNNKTGFICKNEKDLIFAIKNAKKINRKACRADCQNRFSIQKMASDYEKIYQKLLDKKR
jgi:glycosyltransferase involved in cell wall biosynthesis